MKNNLKIAAKSDKLKFISSQISYRCYRVSKGAGKNRFAIWKTAAAKKKRIFPLTPACCCVQVCVGGEKEKHSRSFPLSRLTLPKKKHQEQEERDFISYILCLFPLPPHTKSYQGPQRKLSLSLNKRS